MVLILEPHMLRSASSSPSHGTRIETEREGTVVRVFHRRLPGEFDLRGDGT